MRIQRSAEHRVVPWANGLGVTADVFLSPSNTADWTWRLSIADLSDDVPFSLMPGIDRHIVVARGYGMALTIDGAPEHSMNLGTPPLSFAGESVTSCRLLDGPIAGLNLMVRRGRAVGSLEVLPVPPAQPVFAPLDAAAFVVLDGSVRVGDHDLGMFDAVLLEDVHGGPLPDVFCGGDGARLAFACVAAPMPICGMTASEIDRLRRSR